MKYHPENIRINTLQINIFKYYHIKSKHLERALVKIWISFDIDNFSNVNEKDILLQSMINVLNGGSNSLPVNDLMSLMGLQANNPVPSPFKVTYIPAFKVFFFIIFLLVNG